LALDILDAITGELIRRSDAFVPQKKMFLPPTAEGILSAPGAAGGANWPPSAYSPLTNLLYVIALDWPFIVSRRTVPVPAKGEINIGGGQRPEEKPQGVLSAISPATGKIAWQVKTDPLWSGELVTAGGILFAGDSNGRFRAYDGTFQPMPASETVNSVSNPRTSVEQHCQSCSAARG
jgi:alcohol dehydrogenase (cytochrome c)